MNDKDFKVLEETKENLRKADQRLIKLRETYAELKEKLRSAERTVEVLTHENSALYKKIDELSCRDSFHDEKRYRYVGYEHYRVADGPQERIFAKLWRRHDEQTQILQSLLEKEGGASLRDYRVAATVIQWLGTNCGRAFVHETLMACMKECRIMREEQQARHNFEEALRDSSQYAQSVEKLTHDLNAEIKERTRLQESTCWSYPLRRFVEKQNDPDESYRGVLE